VVNTSAPRGITRIVDISQRGALDLAAIPNPSNEARYMTTSRRDFIKTAGVAAGAPVVD